MFWGNFTESFKDIFGFYLSCLVKRVKNGVLYGRMFSFNT